MNDLEEFVAEILPAIAEGRVRQEDLEHLWSGLFPEEDYASRRGRDAFLDGFLAVASGGSSNGSDLAFRPGGWEVNLGKGIVQTSVATALLGGVLAMLGAAQVPAAVLTAVIPLLFDIGRVRLTEGQGYVLAELVVDPRAQNGELSAEQLHESLSPALRQSVSLLDFRDFLATFRRAGLADDLPDGNIRLRPADRAKFRISFR
ncbi:hypothetical protein LO762_32020 [Actinocorallia sp. API 0066]|uniref:hypothetical protein n=1 Tax=Actinocorallia sp. API 0066 TaxID=2896846 RepID=UPI001E607125|nr:hypothetical protein [Actinocorallia sp. API 0066]MCD0453777.1 hypothetical protein [Actinocorallia sp. API 0066]